MITLRRAALCASLTLVSGCDRERLPTAGEAQPAFHAVGGATGWSAPVNLGPVVNSATVETSPQLSPDGRTLYFNSDRPGGLGGQDIWVTQRTAAEAPWGLPVNLGAPINTSFNDNLPAMSHDGHLLFFASERPGGQGSSDIYVVQRTDPNDDFGWAPPVALGPDVNTAAFEAAPSYMPCAEPGRVNFYFSRGPNSSDVDIYAVGITRNGESVGPAERVDISALSPVSDAHPSLSVNCKEVVFYSQRSGGLGAADLWIATRHSPAHDWSTPVNFGAPINTSAVDIHPSLSFDGHTLLWSSARAGGSGNRDLWMATREH